MTEGNSHNMESERTALRTHSQEACTDTCERNATLMNLSQIFLIKFQSEDGFDLFHAIRVKNEDNDDDEKDDEDDDDGDQSNNANGSGEIEEGTGDQDDDEGDNEEDDDYVDNADDDGDGDDDGGAGNDEEAYDCETS